MDFNQIQFSYEVKFKLGCMSKIQPVKSNLAIFVKSAHDITQRLVGSIIYVRNIS
jgi:hypothetical protein